MERKKRIIIIVTILLSLIELFIYFNLLEEDIFKFSDKYQKGFDDIINYLTPAGILYILNYYIFAPLIYHFICFIWHISGHYGQLFNFFELQVNKCLNWITSTTVHWGVFYSSTECQNANTCEALLALKKASYDNKYENIYENAKKDVLNNVTEKGLPSKSLQCETVVCTSMILYLIALEQCDKAEPDAEIDERFENIAKELWDCRSDRGWGVYVEHLSPKFCCVANTFWALLAISYYNVSKTKEYEKYVRSIYEYSNDSLFGFFVGDSPRLCTTAMAIILYFSLREEIQKSIDQVFDVNVAIGYVFENFVFKDTQCEVEILRGIDLKCTGPKKAPWTHMTMGFAMRALNLAYKNKKISLIKMDIYLYKLKLLCKKGLHRISDCQSYFIPKGMELRENGLFTFPTAYFVMGLSDLIPENNL